MESGLTEFNALWMSNSDFQSKCILTLLLTLLLALRERKAVFWQNIEYWVPAIGFWKGVEKKGGRSIFERS